MSFPNPPNCKNFDGCCHEGDPCSCDWIRQECSDVITNEGVAELSKERGFTVLTAKQAKLARFALVFTKQFSGDAGMAFDHTVDINALIRELEGKP